MIVSVNGAARDGDAPAELIAEDGNWTLIVRGAASSCEIAFTDIGDKPDAAATAKSIASDVANEIDAALT